MSERRHARFLFAIVAIAANKGYHPLRRIASGAAASGLHSHMRVLIK
jgi:hypothetical protein